MRLDVVPVMTEAFELATRGLETVAGLDFAKVVVGSVSHVENALAARVLIVTVVG